MKTILWFFLSLTALPLAAAERPAAIQLREMNKLNFLIGEWQGEGSITVKRSRRPFIGTEKVESKLEGRLLTIEGLHKIILPSTGREKVVLNAYAVLSYDEKDKVYRFRTYVANGQTGEHVAKLADGALEWSYRDPSRGTVRYRVTQDSKGRWVETGHASQDGEKWEPFFEMTLERVK